MKSIIYQNKNGKAEREVRPSIAAFILSLVVSNLMRYMKNVIGSTGFYAMDKVPLRKYSRRPTY